jgi:hypothetical protein
VAATRKESATDLIRVLSEPAPQEPITPSSCAEEEAPRSAEAALLGCAPCQAVTQPEPFPYVRPRGYACEESDGDDDAKGARGARGEPQRRVLGVCDGKEGHNGHDRCEYRDKDYACQERGV